MTQLAADIFSLEDSDGCTCLGRTLEFPAVLGDHVHFRQQREAMGPVASTTAAALVANLLHLLWSLAVSGASVPCLVKS